MLLHARPLPGQSEAPTPRPLLPWTPEGQQWKSPPTSCNSCSQAGRALPQTLFSLLFSIHSALNLSCFFLSSALAKWCSGLSPFSQTLAWEVRRDCSVTVCERVVCLSCCLHLLRVRVSRGYRCVLAWE